MQSLREFRLLFLLGHSTWGYLFCRGFGRVFGKDVGLPLALLVGILPDFDLYFKSLGLQHHTYTHSLLVLGPVCAILVIWRGREGAVLSAGLLSHPFTDALVGTIPPLYPLSQTQIGLSLGIPSAIDTILEAGALFLVLTWMLLNGDARQVVRRDSKNLQLSLPLISIVSLNLLFAQDNDIQLSTYAFYRLTLSVISVGHIILSLVTGLAVVQGFHALARDRRSFRIRTPWH